MRCVVVLVFCAPLLLACGSFRLVPIQMARVPQLETYEQVFTIGQAKSDSEEDQQEAFSEIDRVFGKLLGARNWQSIKDLYGFAAIRHELDQQDIKLYGSFMTMIYLDPTSHDAFLVEGRGRYFLIRESNGLIMLNGVFLIRPSIHRVAALDNGLLHLDVQIITTRIPGKETFYYESELKYQIAINTILGDEGIYVIDYDAAHKVFQSGDEIGYATLQSVESTGLGEKVIDLRGRPFLRNDYSELLGFEE